MMNPLATVRLALLLATLLATPALAQVSTDPQPRNVLLEGFTAINCGNCPAGHATAAIIAAANPERVVLMNVHAGSLSVPSGAQPDLRTPWGNQLHGAYGVTFTPQGLVSRKPHNGTTLLGAASWGAATNALLSQTAIVNIGITTDLDPGTRQLTVDVEHYYTATSPGAPDRLHVVLTEDHLIAYQANYGPGGAQPAYDHRHTVRAALTAFAGEALGPGAQGESGMHSYSIILPMGWDEEHVRAVAFVSEENGEVHQVSEASAIEGGASSIDESVPMVFVMAPNPASDHLTVLFGRCPTGAITVRDATGQLVHQLRVAQGQRAAGIDVRGWSNGVYFVSDANGHSARLLIQR